jgi:hypothetical protein
MVLFFGIYYEGGVHMYPEVKFSKRITEKWLKQAFAPLHDYLRKEYSDEADLIIAYVDFVDNCKQRFYYRNSQTKGSIVFDQEGHLVSCDKYALQYEFERPEKVKIQRLPREERFIHSNVTRWMSKRLSQKQISKYGEEICIFLQEYWGPIVNYNFDDLKVSYPIQGSMPAYCLYIYSAEFPTMVAIQFVGDEIVERRCSFAQYRNFQKRERDLIYKGWHVVTIIREVLDEEPEHFHLYLAQAIKLGMPRDPVYILTETGRDALMKD